MHNEIKIEEGLYYVGGSDRRLHLFENTYPLVNGASFNSYLYLDEKTLLLDTVEGPLDKEFFENIDFLLNGRKLDYLIVNHMEPDHAANIGDLLLRHPETTIVLSSMAKRFLLNYFPSIKAEIITVKEGDTLSIGEHEFTFVMAPMVHWPEVMFTYEKSRKVLFSADAFGTFGALSGDIFASSFNFDINEARRYYTNIVGKYGDQVLSVLRKAVGLEINMICPLHGPIHKGNLAPLMNKYILWASYTPEDKDGVLIVYNSVYGNTANMAMKLGSLLSERGIKNLVMHDASKTHVSYLIAESFRVGTIVLAGTTYNAGVFIEMENYLHDLANHGIRNRNIAILENGSWAPAAKRSMKEILKDLSNITYFEKEITIASTMKENQLPELVELADEIVSKVSPKKEMNVEDKNAVFNLSYGLFVIFSKDGEGKDDGSINNSFFQVADSPVKFILSVNKKNLTAENILKNKRFNVSVLDNRAPFSLFKRFGFVSGRDEDKLSGFDPIYKDEDGYCYLKEFSNACFECEVEESKDIGSHILFTCHIKKSIRVSSLPSMTYAYYHTNVKPLPVPEKKKEGEGKRVGWRCKVCGFTYWGETLPEGYVCPLCKHPASDFVRIEE